MLTPSAFSLHSSPSENPDRPSLEAENFICYIQICCRYNDVQNGNPKALKNLYLNKRRIVNYGI